LEKAQQGRGGTSGDALRW